MMDHMPIPPQYQPPLPGMSYGKKILLLGLQCGVLMIGALAIWIMVFSREETNRNVAREISGEWGGEVEIFGPYISDMSDSIPNVYPESFTCHIEVKSKSLHRNIYEAEVYSAHVNLSGTFNEIPESYPCESVVIRLNADPARIPMISSLKFDGSDIEWNAGDGFL
ncbi:MAG: cell envelope integrity protein CreD, partial [Duncaniella sp.]|nr:cell envelope integrity protein CreD [Duncaniella sp.]